MPSSESWLSGEDIRVFAKCDQLTLNQAKFNVFADDLAGDPVHVTHWNRTCVMEVALLDDWNTVAAESAKYSEAHHVKKEEEVDDASLLLGDHQHTAIDVDGDTSGPPAHWWQSDDECGILELDSSGHEGSEFQPEDSPASELVDDDVRLKISHFEPPTGYGWGVMYNVRIRVVHLTFLYMLNLAHQQRTLRSCLRFPCELRSG